MTWSPSCKRSGRRPPVAVEAVIVDLDGTLLSGDSIVDGALEMLRSLRERGYIVVIASNRPNAASRIDRAGLEYDAIIDRVSVGSNKGTADWVNSVCANFNLEPNSVVWLGDADMDFYAALAGRLTYFNAAWSAPDFRYGIPLTHPMALLDVLGQCFSKEHLWYCKLETTDQLGRRVSQRSLIDGRGAGSAALKRDLISFFKESGSPRNLASFVLLHLLGSIYDEGLHREWIIGPSIPGMAVDHHLPLHLTSTLSRSCFGTASSRTCLSDILRPARVLSRATAATLSTSTIRSIRSTSIRSIEIESRESGSWYSTISRPRVRAGVRPQPVACCTLQRGYRSHDREVSH